MDAKRATALSATALVVAVLGYTPLGQGAQLTGGTLSSANMQASKRDAGLANVAIRVSPAFVDPGAGSEEGSVSCQTGVRTLGGGGTLTHSSIAEDPGVARPRWGEWAR
jgi:hypothetical protein